MATLYVYAIDGVFDEMVSVREVPVVAASEKAAHKLAWDSLPDDVKDTVASMELVDVIDGVEVDDTPCGLCGR